MCSTILNSRLRPNRDFRYVFVKLKRFELEDLKKDLEDRNKEINSEMNSFSGLQVRDNEKERSKRLFQKPVLLQSGENNFWHHVRSRWSLCGAIVGGCCCCSDFGR